MIRTIKARRIRWEGNVAYMQGFNRKGRKLHHYEDLDVGRNIILKWILGK
jgi:hypothetical protein